MLVSYTGVNRVKICVLVFVVVAFVDGRSNKIEKTKLKIGGIFHASQEQEQAAAFSLAVDLLNNNNSHLPFTLVPITATYENRNALSIWDLTCRLLEHGVVAIIGPNSRDIFPYVQAISDRKELPQLIARWYFDDKRNNYAINLHPHPHVVERIFMALLDSLQWKKFSIIYQDNESLSKIHQLLSYNSNEYDIKLRQMELDKRGTYRTILNYMKNNGETHFVVLCELKPLKELLQQAQQVGLLGEKNHYLIYNFDLTNIDMEPYQYGGCNIISIRLVNPDNPDTIEATHLIPRILRNTYGRKRIQPQHTLNLEAALVMDAVRLIHKTITKSDIKDYKDLAPLYCNSTDGWTKGSSFINDIKTRNTIGYTGLVKFDSDGYRSDFEAEIIELTSTGLTKIGTWNNTTGLSIKRHPVETSMEDDEYGLRNKTFTVVTVLTAPYGMLKKTVSHLEGNDRYEGYGIDLIQDLSKMIGFNYTFIIQKDGANGNYDRRTKEWDGMIGKILKKEADLAIGDLTVTSEREVAVDFTLPFMPLGIGILYKKPEPVPPSLFMFTSPFSGEVWLLIVISYIFVSVALFIMGRLCPSEWQNPYPCVEEPNYLINQFSFKNSLWFTIGSLMEQGTELAPIGASTRTLAGVWWFFILIMCSSYTANLAAFLTVTTLQTPFKNIEELAKQTEIKYGAKANGSTASFFKDSDRDVYRAMWKYMALNPEVMVNDNQDGVKRVGQKNYAFLMESTTIEYVTERQCNLAKVGGQLDDKGYSIAMRKGEKFRLRLNSAILKLQETGRLTELKIRWWKEKHGGGTCQKASSASTVTELDFQNVGGVFLVLCIGTILGVLFSFIEFGWEIWTSVNGDRSRYSKQMKKEVKFLLKFKNVKSVRRYNAEREDVSYDISLSNKNYLENYINENNQNT